MYQVIQTYGDDEPWWFFENWKEQIQKQVDFESFLEAECYLEEQIIFFQKKCEHQKANDKYLIAFWNDGDLAFCEDCDEDLQQYYGLLLLKDGKPLSEDERKYDETINYNGKTKCCKRLSACPRSN